MTTVKMSPLRRRMVEDTRTIRDVMSPLEAVQRLAQGSG